MENTENQVITHLKIEGDRQDRPCIDRNKAFRDRGWPIRTAEKRQNNPLGEGGRGVRRKEPKKP